MVKVLEPEKSKEALEKEDRIEAAKATREQQLADFTKDLAAYTKWLFGATSVLAAVTLGTALLIWRQVRDARDAIDAARISADAAKRSAEIAEDALIHLERAYLFITKFSTNLEYLFAGIQVPDLKGRPSFRIDMINYGRTTANLTTGFVHVEIADNLPDPITFGGGGESSSLADRQEVEIFIGPGREYFLDNLTWQKEYGYDRVLGIKNGTTSLYIHGFIRYIDIFMKPHEIVYLRRYNPKTQEFDPVGGVARNRCT
ncbi:MAG TPA: hypothetical protein VKS60_18040 [Stellaceae bacterium]|nr:hypothetical protein [Stellaceae bacterium]